MIRPALETDIAVLVGMGRRFHAASPWRDKAPLSDEALAVSLAAFLDGPSAAILVSERNGQIVCAIGLLVAPIYFTAGLMAAQELFWFGEAAARESLALLRAGEQWATDQGASLFCMIRLEGLRDEALDTFYRRKGYQPMEHSYVRELT